MNACARYTSLIPHLDHKFSYLLYLPLKPPYVFTDHHSHAVSAMDGVGHPVNPDPLKHELGDMSPTYEMDDKFT
ncbi:hypothetical protein [Microvirga massiliensis]|uniref:hypothetical protein n=1 Tax=Microvirga massiliensis TaxID=1033741 RepID=UPI00062BDB0E|nr:hypothetical protein [Microvirga massiliensis]